MVLWHMIRSEEEVKRYKVPAAKYPEKHEILDRPTIKVTDPFFLGV
jgi:hypothetical protein